MDNSQMKFIDKSQFMFYDTECGHRKIKVYSTEYMFKSADAAWRFLFGKMFEDRELFTVVDVFPDRDWDREYLTKKEKESYDRIKNQTV